MRCINIPLQETGFVHKLSADYISGNETLKDLFAFKPDFEGITEALKQRSDFPVDRSVLVNSLKRQYARLDPAFLSLDENLAVKNNIEALSSENTFTITAGHQLNIFTGPLYYIYKLVSVINYTKELKIRFPENNFVPIYWMATEDHDFEEINHFYLWGKKYEWAVDPAGAVGRMDPRSMKDLLDVISTLNMPGDNGKFILDLFKKAYLEHSTMADATRYIVHSLFKNEGLLVIDADDVDLKQAMIPVFEKDIFENAFFEAVNTTTAPLQKKYKIPVSPREINVFYLSEGSRNRIIYENGTFSTDGASKTWNETALRTELNSHPENFSPNVVLRPIYQELILPNLAYVGGNGEIAYWLELKNAFKTAGTFYPQLLLRDSALFVAGKAAKYLDTFHLSPQDLFLSQEELVFKFYDVNMLEHPAEKDAKDIEDQYEILKNHLQGLPPDMVGGIVKQLNIHVKEVRRWKNEVHNKQLELQEKNVEKLGKIRQSVFPDGQLQERHDSFIPFYLQYGQDWMQTLYSNFDPTMAKCHIFVEDEK